LHRLLAILVFLALGSFGQGKPDFDSLSAQATEAREGEHVDEAVKLYRRALQSKPDWAEGLWYLGTLSYDKQQFADAAAALTRLIQLSPKDPNAFAMLGLSEVKLKRNEPALDHLTQALTLGVGDDAKLRQVVLFNQALLLLENGAFGRAQAILYQVVQNYGAAENEVVTALGESVLGIRSPSLSTEEQDVILAAGKAELLSARRETEQAHAAYAELTARYPKVHNVQFAYGRFLLSNHLDEQAVAAFKLEIENSPQHLLARLGIAGVLLATDPPTSLLFAQQAVKLAPRIAEAHYLLGAALLGTEHPEQAIAELETAEHLKTDDPRIYFALAKAYARVHLERDAARARARFMELSPKQQ